MQQGFTWLESLVGLVRLLRFQIPDRDAPPPLPTTHKKKIAASPAQILTNRASRAAVESQIP